MKAIGRKPTLLVFSELVDITEERKFVAHILRFMSHKMICGSNFSCKYPRRLMLILEKQIAEDSQWVT